MRYKVVRCSSRVFCEPRTRTPNPDVRLRTTDHGPLTTSLEQCPTLPDPTVRPSTSRPKCARGQPPEPRRLAPRRRPPAPDSRLALPPWPGAAGETRAASGLGIRDSGFGIRREDRGSPIPNADLFQRTPNPESRTLLFPRIPNPSPRPVFLRNIEAIHPKRARPMGIHQFRRADISLPHHTGNARQRQLQFFRVGRERKKQSALRHARLHGFGRQRHLHHRRRRRVRLQVQQQQFQKQLGISRGDGQAEASGHGARDSGLAKQNGVRGSGFGFRRRRRPTGGSFLRVPSPESRVPFFFANPEPRIPNPVFQPPTVDESHWLPATAPIIARRADRGVVLE